MRDLILDLTNEGDFTGYLLAGCMLVFVVPILLLLSPLAIIGWLLRRLIDAR